jgi:hypothetical protein
MFKAIDTFQEVELLCKSSQTTELTWEIIQATDAMLRDAHCEFCHYEIALELKRSFPSVTLEALNEFVVARAVAVAQGN